MIVLPLLCVRHLNNYFGNLEFHNSTLARMKVDNDQQ